VERAKKKQIVSDMHTMFLASKVVIIAHYHGLTVSQITDLRKEVRKVGAKFQVSKNSLANLAVENTNFKGLTKLFTGPISVASSADPVSLAKVMTEYAKTNEKFLILGGIVDEQFVDLNQIKLFASLPSLDELRAKIVGLLNAPATKIVRVLQTPGGQVARVLAAHSKKNN
jgi:large subunit ribosomal protein L10